MTRYVILVAIGLLPSLTSTVVAQQWQVNQPVSALTFDGEVASATIPAITTVSPAEVVTVASSSTNPGAGWEIALGSREAVPASNGGTTTAGGQVLNLDLADPTLAFLQGGAVPAFVPFPGNLSFPVVGAAGLGVVAQQVVLDATLADGLALSQAATLRVTTGVILAGPSADDGALTIALGGALGGPAAIVFYATTYTEITVMSNGRVMPGNVGDGDFSPSVAEALGDNAFVGFWTDLDPSSGGSILVSAPTPTTLRVDWRDIIYFDENLSFNRFGVAFDSSTFEVCIDGLGGITSNPEVGFSFPEGDAQFLGISGGANLASDGGPTTFALGGSGIGSVLTDMIYDFNDSATQTNGLVTSLVTGDLSEIRFTPAPTGVPAYFWAGL